MNNNTETEYFNSAGNSDNVISHPTSQQQSNEDNVDGAYIWPPLQSIRAEQEDAARVEYPLSSLPKPIAAAVRDAVDFIQCPVALAACSALSSLSLAGQSLIDVRRGGRLTGPCSLYFLVVAKSGERKTQIDKEFMEPIRDRQAALDKAFQRNAIDYEAKRKQWNSDGNKLTRGSSQRAKADKIEHEGTEPEPPVGKRLLYGNTTMEALLTGIHEKHSSVGLVSDEAGGFLGGYAMNAERLVGTMAQLNTLWGGRAEPVDRKTSDSFTIHWARLTISLAVQEKVLSSFVGGSSGSVEDIGFSARFLFAFPESTIGHRTLKLDGDFSALDAFKARISHILDLSIKELEKPGNLPVVVGFDADAQEEWVNYFNDTERSMQRGGINENFTAVVSKAAEQVARLAGLFHLYTEDWATGGADIGVDAVRSAIAVVSWHIEEYRRFFGVLAMPEGLQDLVQFDEWLIKRASVCDGGIIQRSSVLQIAPAKFRKASIINPFIKDLVAYGRLRSFVRNGTGYIQINPELLR